MWDLFDGRQWRFARGAQVHNQYMLGRFGCLAWAFDGGHLVLARVLP